MKSFNEFIKNLKIDNHPLGEIVFVEDHRINFAKMYILNKITSSNNIYDTRQTGKTTHNILIALYKQVVLNEKSLIVVSNTQEKQRAKSALASFLRQIIDNQLNYDKTQECKNIDILSINAWKDQKILCKSKKYDHIFVDNEIVEKFISFTNEESISYDKGNDYYVGMCLDLTTKLRSIQKNHNLKSLNCLKEITKFKIITSDDIEFNAGSLFLISPGKDFKTHTSSEIGTILNINYDNSVKWASSIDVMIGGKVITTPVQNIEYFTAV